MAPVPFTLRLRRLLWSGMLAGVSGVALAGLSSPAQAQYNPYCYAPYYNAYYCQYYSHNYNYPAYPYNYNYPAYPYNSYSYYNYPYYNYPYYGFGLAAPLGFGLGFAFGGGDHFRHDHDRGFVGREFHEDHHGFAGGEFHGGHRGGPPVGAGGSAGAFHPSPVQQYFAPVFNAARHNNGGGGGGGHHHH